MTFDPATKMAAKAVLYWVAFVLGCWFIATGRIRPNVTPWLAWAVLWTGTLTSLAFAIAHTHDAVTLRREQ